VAGEPIVRSPADALRCFLDAELDMLVMEDHVVRRSDVGRASVSR
jgi:predicted NodU family carbamoyl transferase